MTGNPPKPERSISHYTCAKYAAGAYSLDDSIRLPHGLEYTPNFIPQSGLHVIAVQGSDFDPRDWLRNLFSWGTRDPVLGKTPYGFSQASLRLANEICHLVHNSEPIVLTGHSAGASIAVLTAERLYQRGWNVVECVGFAPARVGKRPLHVHTTLYDHAGDIVCKLPWWWRHPVRPIKLPDQTHHPFQHAMDYYLEAMRTMVSVK